MSVRKLCKFPQKISLIMLPFTLNLLLVVASYGIPKYCCWSGDKYFCDENPIRETNSGSVRGTTKVSRDGREFHSFTGIPYAQPPVGSLRFASPVPNEPWGPYDTYNATEEPPTCIQRNYLFSNNPSIEGQEDCLYLNVFVPKIQEATKKLLPVMVFIHWGGFLMGRSTTGYLGPDYLMDKDIILVTFNYRLGPFGFLSTLDDEAPGNFGLKDQVLALKWVQDNIEYFGGNKDRVTISGQSAGAASAHYHMLSPSSKGLFSQAISESGSALNIWAQPLNSLRLQVTFAQAQFVGCPNTTDTSVLVSCLRNVPADTIMQTQDYFKTFFGDPVSTYSIVIEKKTDKNPNPFITKAPLEYIESGELANVPWIVGTNQNEGLLRAPSRIRPKEVRDALNANFSFILPDILGFALDNNDPVGLYHRSVKNYLGGQEYVNISNPESVQGFVNLYSDRLFVYGTYQAIMKSAAKGNKNIFMYSFNYRGTYTYGEIFATTRENIDFKWGTSHCDELIYLFRSPDFFPSVQSQDLVMSKVLTDLWTNFVINGNPNSNTAKILGDVSWDPLLLSQLGSIKNEDVVLLNFTGNTETGPKFHVSTGFYSNRMKFWDENS